MVYTEAQNRQDRRIQRTRTLLKRAFDELVSENGYDAVTIQDITERANVARATFYLHFKSKDELSDMPPTRVILSKETLQALDELARKENQTVENLIIEGVELRLKQNA